MPEESSISTHRQKLSSVPGKWGRPRRGGEAVLNLGNSPPPGQAQRSPKPFGPRTPKESEKSPKRCPGAEPQSPQRVRHGVRKESKKSPKLLFWTLFGLRGDSFWTLLGFRARRARETSVPGRGVPNSKSYSAQSG